MHHSLRSMTISKQLLIYILIFLNLSKELEGRSGSCNFSSQVCVPRLDSFRSCPPNFIKTYRGDNFCLTLKKGFPQLRHLKPKLDGIKEKSIHLSTYFIIYVPYCYLTTHSICQLIIVTCIFEVMASNHPINEGKTGDIYSYLS